MSARVLPVGAFVCLFREVLETDPVYSDLWLEGEISDFSRSAAGHLYFNLRDDLGCLKCVMFRRQALRLYHRPAMGEQVAVHGGLSLYPRSGAVQLVVDLVQPAGLGAAALELEYLRQRLDAEGLFDPLRKRAIPASPRVIGVVTSAHGAAWHDIQTVIARRYPLASLVLSPAQVQGSDAAASIVAAIEAVQEDDRVDVVILARGGGASDDLAAFNDERVVRAVFACRIPVITGVGHATDRTLVEDVADCSAPTPSAAAEVAAPSIAELFDRLRGLESRLTWLVAAQHADAVLEAQSFARRLTGASPATAVRDRQRALAAATSRLGAAVDRRVADRRYALAGAHGLLGALDPTAVLRRGYAVLQTGDGVPLASVEQVRRAGRFVAVVADGSIGAAVASGPRGAATAAVDTR